MLQMVTNPIMICITICGMVGNILIIAFFGSRHVRLASVAATQHEIYGNVETTVPHSKHQIQSDLQNRQQLERNSRKKPYYLFLVHLAVADLLACTLVPVYNFPIEFTGYWHYGYFLCRYTRVVPTGVCIYSSCWILFGIIYERYRSIVHPFKRKMSATIIHLICACAWLFSLLIHVPYYMSTGYEQVVSKDNVTGKITVNYLCFNNMTNVFNGNFLMPYFVCRVFTQAVLPVALMVFFYSRVQSVVARSNELVKRSSNGSTSSDVRSLSPSIRHARNNKAILRALCAALVIFALTIVPNIIGLIVKTALQLYYPRGWHESALSRLSLEMCIRMLAFSSAANCFVYAGNMTDFRKFLLRVLTCSRLRQKCTRKKSM